MRVGWWRFSVRQEADEPPESSPDSVSVSGISSDARQHFDGDMLEHVRVRVIDPGLHLYGGRRIRVERPHSPSTYEVRGVLDQELVEG